LNDQQKERMKWMREEQKGDEADEGDGRGGIKRGEFSTISIGFFVDQHREIHFETA
jgi:hypothetical protein